MKRRNKKRPPGAVIFAIAALLCVLVFVFVNTLLLHLTITRLEDRVEATQTEYGAWAELYEKFLKSRTYMSITVNHDDIAAVEEEFAEILGALRIGDKEAAEIAKSRLESALGHLKRLSGFNLDSII